MQNQYITVQIIKSMIELGSPVEIFVFSNLGTFTIQIRTSAESDYLPFASLTTDRVRGKSRQFKTLDAAHSCIIKEIGSIEKYSVIL